MVAQFDHFDGDVLPGVPLTGRPRPEGLGGRLGEAVGQETGRRRLPEPGGHDGEGRHRTSLAFSRPAPATREAWVGAVAGTCAGRMAANSFRSTGRNNSPTMSICSRTVFSGSPAWSIRNSWRW